MKTMKSLAVLLSGAAAVPQIGLAAEPAGETKPLPPGSPNVLIILLDDAGFAQSDTVGGEIHTPTLTRIAQSGIIYNAFHTTAISSATRAALLTGRNHHHVGNGTVTEIATEYDGYTGVIPKTAATLPQVLRSHGYATAAFGKWHNTPAHETSRSGPFDRWPTGYGFDHFYGFLGGETDQYHPRLVNDTTLIEPPADAKYHLTADIADQAINWLDQHQAKAPGQPFFLYWAPGAVHAPHQVPKEWADKYKGKFDAGWDDYRQRVFQRQKEIGWIPGDTRTTPRPDEMPAWDGLSAEEKAFHAREMEVFAGFLEHADTQAGRLVDEVERLGLRDNTLIFYVFSDNGASSEGTQGAINDLIALNGITTTAKQHIEVLNRDYGGLDALGGPKLNEHYAAAWAWASESPFVGTKLVAGYFGGTRTPLAVSWPKAIHADKAIRGQFSHVVDIAPTVYDVLGIQPPSKVDGVAQEPVDGVSLAYTFSDATAANRKTHQYFEIMGSRAEYVDGWIASVFGPRKPWVADQSALVSLAGKVAILTGQSWIGDRFGWLSWSPDNDKWALYDLKKDYSQANDVAAANPQKLAEVTRLFDEDAKANNVYPLGAGFWGIFHRHEQEPGRTVWHFGAETSRLPEVAAPNIRSRDNRVTVDADFPPDAHGVLFAMGGVSGGLTLYAKDGRLTYEYNGMALKRTKVSAPLPNGHALVSVEMNASRRRGGPASVSLAVDGKEVAKGDIPYTIPLVFTATESFDVGLDLGSPVALDYYDLAPFKFSGRINDVLVEYR